MRSEHSFTHDAIASKLSTQSNLAGNSRLGGPMAAVSRTDHVDQIPIIDGRH